MSFYNVSRNYWGTYRVPGAVSNYETHCPLNYLFFSETVSRVGVFLKTLFRKYLWFSRDHT